MKNVPLLYHFSHPFELRNLWICWNFLTGQQALVSYFCYYFGRNSYKMNLESLSLPDRFDILSGKEAQREITK